MKSTQISSPVLTFSLKIALPLIWLSFGALILMGIEEGLNQKGTVAALALWVFCAMVMYTFGVRLKNVYMDSEHIFITNYIQKVKVPLGQVVEIRERRIFS